MQADLGQQNAPLPWRRLFLVSCSSPEQLPTVAGKYLLQKGFEFREAFVLPKPGNFLLHLDWNGSVAEQQGQRSLACTCEDCPSAEREELSPLHLLRREQLIFQEAALLRKVSVAPRAPLSTPGHATAL